MWYINAHYDLRLHAWPAARLLKTTDCLGMANNEISLFELNYQTNIVSEIVFSDFKAQPSQPERQLKCTVEQLELIITTK